MIELLILVLVLAVLGVAAVLAWRSRRSTAASREAQRDPFADEPAVYDPHRIGVGDVITYAGVDHVVRGTIVLEEGGVVWREHLLDGSTGRRWLSVEDDEGELELTLWTRREGAGMAPDGDVVVDDRVHRQVERGRAAFTAEGATGTPAAGSVDYADYATRDGLGLLAFERWARRPSPGRSPPAARSLAASSPSTTRRPADERACERIIDAAPVRSADRAGSRRGA